jgi:required for meiotic nuclear division protein 1
MTTSSFCALALAPEIPLPALAEQFGIDRRFAWEDPMELSGNALRQVLPSAGSERVFLFAFGSMVFVDCSEQNILAILDYLCRQYPTLCSPQPFRWNDHYRLTVNADAPASCNQDGATIPSASPSSTLILATILAKSVALERVEATLETVLDRSEKRIEALEKGKLRGADASLARDAGAVLRLEHESIHYLGLIDKPESTWNDETADILYKMLARQFELRDRYSAVSHRVEVLKDLGSTFANLAHARRSARLEWVIILLIAFEIVLPAVKWVWQQLPV